MGTEQTAAAHRTAAAGAPPGARQSGLDRIGTSCAVLTERPVSLYAAAVLRIGYGFLYLVFLLREFPYRDEIWGPGAPWTPDLARQLFDQTGWLSVLTLFDSRAYFEICYAAALVTSGLFMAGWRTRAVSVLFAVVVASFHARAIFMTDGGDNVTLLMAVYLMFTACGRHWSLDARRARLRGPAGIPAGRRTRHFSHVRRTLTTVLHNCGMFVIAAQVCFLYGSAGLYKVQGGSWGNGTALHYVLNLDLFRPWPAVSLMADAHPVPMAVAGYLTVLLQVAFPFVLFGRLKYPVLTVLLGMHLGIAVLLGLPLFSGAMIIADAVFLPDRFYRSLGRLWRRVARRPEPTAAPGQADQEPVPVPPQHPGRPNTLPAATRSARVTAEAPVSRPVP
ncbi:HTTM domain-containing protein [Streptomyces sp. G-G2]|uniref:HTTM domain-containing protein n=1 Tax=Streptomyces sp. G-G2 TaxID=3046201 RepID=UPI0024BB1ED3|nr:HTTM domain-containing protein [Streptomyces sp. G-G2]MDJ0382495.1 HTTM domain-containing protein [Streptomyces sp. G-G2]